MDEFADWQIKIVSTFVDRTFDYEMQRANLAIEKLKSTIGLDEIVKNYLMHKGYLETVRTLEKESKVVVENNDEQRNGPTGFGTESVLEETRKISMKMLSIIAEDLFVSGFKDGDLNLYFEGYEQIRNWALYSLDIVKPQLLSICFPLFIYW